MINPPVLAFSILKHEITDCSKTTKKFWKLAVFGEPDFPIDIWLVEVSFITMSVIPEISLN